ncbi:MAG: ATP-binding cassette domain-containing protein [Symploca sp. SIO1C4]|uniref:ATP-binding cassette domain-containing protein n=1 Tax=Symploca sp. SIO1C4 TaxID=2607765 RepID=A0A6B3NI96_9CYAN|nr:ATP-binding cassette domain-containing protein [Symploca sp. SIO1C4]
MATVEFDRVFKTYKNGYRALKNLCLNIEDGEFLVFVGPSGCGKSTVLRTLAGLEDITAGKLIIGGDVVNNKTPQQRNIAMVFQNYALYPHMTVRQNLEFPLRMMNVPPEERQLRIQKAAHKLELTQQLNKKPKQLSGGQQQRAAMGRAIVRNPAVFLMDEPLSNLDAKMRVQIRTEIAQLQKEMGTTTVYVTHDQIEAMTMGDRVAVLRAGELQQITNPQELYDNPANAFVAGFIGSPAMNIFHSQLQKTQSGSFSIDFGGQPLIIDPATVDKYHHLGLYLNLPILAGLRPEAFFLVGESYSQPNCLEVEVDAVEALGHEMIVYFKAPVSRIEVEDNVTNGNGEEDNSTLITRVPSSPDIYLGAKLNLGVDTSKLYLFNADGKAIRD